jgi:hypothetical protein
MVFIKHLKHIDTDWEPGHFLNIRELQKDLLEIWTTSILEKVRHATPKGKTHGLMDSWKITRTNDYRFRDVVNTKEININGVKVHLMHLLHSGRKAMCAKRRDDGSIGALKFFSRGEWWLRRCVGKADPIRMSGEGQFQYNIRQDITDAWYDGDEDAVQRFKTWRPR